MTQRPTSGSDQFSASTSSSGSGFDTVDLGATGGSTTPSASYGTSYNQSSTTGSQGTVDQVKETAGQLADQAQEKASQVADQARGVVASRLSDQKGRAAESLGGVAGALRQTSQSLRDQDQVGVTDYVDSAANQLERISGYLQNTDIGDLVDDVERFARRQPSVFLGGAFVLGLVAARFLKSSSRSSRNYPLATRNTYARTNVYGGYQGRSTNYGTGYGGGTNYGGGTSYSTGTTGGSTYGSSGLGTTGTTGGSTYGSSGLGTTGTTYGSSGLGSTGTTGDSTYGSSGLGTTGTTGSSTSGSSDFGSTGTTSGSTTSFGTGLAGSSTSDQDATGTRSVGGTEEL